VSYSKEFTSHILEKLRLSREWLGSAEAVLFAIYSVRVKFKTFVRFIQAASSEEGATYDDEPTAAETVTVMHDGSWVSKPSR
jgi:hypothetical protein